MRVITGSARGKRLITLEGDAVRPTPSKVKEAIFSVIQFEVEGRRVLDPFTGSGQMAIEALSRGAEQAVMLDSSRDSFRIAEKNLEGAGLKDRAKLLCADAVSYLAVCRDFFDLAFLDPPYKTGLLQKTLPLVEQRMHPGGSIFCEHPWDEEMPETVGNFVRKKSYRYGKIGVTLFRSKDVEQ